MGAATSPRPSTSGSISPSDGLPPPATLASMEAQPAALEARGVTRSLPLGGESVEILRGIDFRIERGDLVALMGPSGSGKSTLLGIIAGLDRPSSGEVLVDGVAIATMPE